MKKKKIEGEIEQPMSKEKLLLFDVSKFSSFVFIVLAWLLLLLLTKSVYFGSHIYVDVSIMLGQIEPNPVWITILFFLVFFLLLVIVTYLCVCIWLGCSFKLKSNSNIKLFCFLSFVVVVVDVTFLMASFLQQCQ